jgi:FlaA1/EpsC-like NDP-sugar epimerase
MMSIFLRIMHKMPPLPRLPKRLIVELADIGLCAVAAYLALYLRLGTIPEVDVHLWLLVSVSAALALPIFRAFGLYREIFSQAGFGTILMIGRACAVYGLAFACIFTIGGFSGVPRTAGLIQPILLFLMVAGSRLQMRAWLTTHHARSQSRAPRRRVAIYGAGSAGRQMAAALLNSLDMQVVAFFDDNAELQGAAINHVAIFPPGEIAQVAPRLRISDVLLALPSASQDRRKEIIRHMRDTALHVRTLPSIADLAHGKVKISDIHELDLNDLLGRTPVAPDLNLMSRYIGGKVVMVTGAGGSIGSELCRQILAIAPRLLLLLDISEFALYRIHRDLEQRAAAGGSTTIIPLLGSVQDEKRVRAIIETWRPDIIFHAAAYKHVPMVEHNPAEGIRNNVLGTRTVAKMAAELLVPDVVLISTDKAVRPTNVMGATKRAAELVIQAYDSHCATTRFSMVRFGNVLGSSGSVVPLFRRQIGNGGPVTITDRFIIRYFMTIPEAAQLVIQAGAMARGGEVFVLDMGEPVRILDLARSMIELSGLSVRDEANPFGDIEIREIGLRPGEKLYEELLIGGSPDETGHRQIMKANEVSLKLDDIDLLLDELEAATGKPAPAEMLEILERIVSEFQRELVTHDWIDMEVARRDLLTR